MVPSTATRWCGSKLAFTVSMSWWEEEEEEVVHGSVWLVGWRCVSVDGTTTYMLHIKLDVHKDIQHAQARGDVNGYEAGVAIVDHKVSSKRAG